MQRKDICLSPAELIEAGRMRIQADRQRLEEMRELLSMNSNNVVTRFMSRLALGAQQAYLEESQQRVLMLSSFYGYDSPDVSS